MDTAGNADHTLDGKTCEAALTERYDLSFRLHTNFESIEKSWRQLERQPGVSPHYCLAWCKAWVATNPSDTVILVGHSNFKTGLYAAVQFALRKLS